MGDKIPPDPAGRSPLSRWIIEPTLISRDLRVKQYGKDVINPFDSFITRFQHQLMILSSAMDRIDSMLTDIEGVLQSELFNHELEVAEDLYKK